MDYNNVWIDTHYFDVIINRVKNIKDKFINNITDKDKDKDKNKEEILDKILDDIEEKYGKKNNKVLLKSKL